MDKAKDFLNKNAMLIVLLLAMLFFEVLINTNGRGSLFSPQNLTNLINQNGYIIILAVGMLMCILTGGNIDLSVGSVVMLVGTLCGVFIVNWGIHPYIAIIMCMLCGITIGAWQAFWIAYIKVPPFIVTLAGMLTFRGLSLVISNQNIGPFPDKFKNLFYGFIPSRAGEVMPDADVVYRLAIIIAVIIAIALFGIQLYSYGQKKRKGYPVDNLTFTLIRTAVIGGAVIFVFTRLGRHNGIPMVLVLIAIVVLIYSYFTQNTIYGRYLYAMGGNEKAAMLSGINTKRMKFFAYTNMGFLASVAAMVCVARFNNASTTAGLNYELDAIASCFIGGASAYGGIGTVSGAVIGALFMGVLNIGMSILNSVYPWLDTNVQAVIKGLVLLAAVVFDVLSKRRKQAAVK